jgi:uncharacterized Tic20 family protein
MSTFNSDPNFSNRPGGPYNDAIPVNGTREWERTYSVFVHLTPFSTFFLPCPLIVALVMWLIKRDQSGFVDAAGKATMNLQISAWLYVIALVLGAFFTCGVTALVALIVPLMVFLFAIFGALAASRGEVYRYPLVIPFFRV